MDLTVLLVESDCAHAQRMAQFFAQVRPGWKIGLAPSLASARQLHALQPPHVAIVAHQLCDGSAQEVLPWLGDTMGMVVVHAGQEFVAAACMRAGFADFVVRPAEHDSNSHLHTLPEQTESLARQKDTENALQVQSSKMSATLSTISQGVISWDVESGRVQVFNDRACALLGVPHALMAEGPLFHDVVEFQRARGEFQERNLYWPPGVELDFLGGSQCPERYVRRTAHGRYLEVHSHAAHEGRRVRTYTDVTDYVYIQERLQASEQRWRSITALSSDWFWTLDIALRFVHLDGCTAPLRAELLGQKLLSGTLWKVSAENQAHFASYQRILQTQAAFHDWELLHIGSDGQALWLSMSGVPMHDAQGAFTGYHGVARDITQRKQAEDAVRRLAYHDDLTGLPNRSCMLQLLDNALQRSLQQGAGALLLLDINRFKDINDGWGRTGAMHCCAPWHNGCSNGVVAMWWWGVWEGMSSW